jgi:uncharacterized protein YbjQ (UPF0145 family)
MATNQRDIDLAGSLYQVQQGGLPTRARQRLADEAGPHKKLFTSDLSVNEFLLARESDMQPISQVMGSSIYHIGRIRDYKGATCEITTISDAHRQSRHLAVSRLAQEAQLVGADAVVGVRLKERWITMGAHGKGGDDGGEIIEFTVVGTAVRAPWITHAPGQPVVTDLSGQDLWALQEEGFEACGFLFEFCRYHVWHVLKQFSGGGEIQPAQHGMTTAQGIVENKLKQQAAAMGAELVVGSDMKLEIHEVPCGWEGCALNDLDVDVSWFATGIRKIPNWKQAPVANVPPLILSMMPLGRAAKGDVVEDEDDADEIQELAKKVEEASAE